VQGAPAATVSIPPVAPVPAATEAQAAPDPPAVQEALADKAAQATATTAATAEARQPDSGLPYPLPRVREFSREIRSGKSVRAVPAEPSYQ
jgi:hypothetical protein